MATFIATGRSPGIAKHSIICYRISSIPSSYAHVVVEEVFKVHAVVRHVGIAPSADFRPGQPFPSPTTRSCAFGNNCLGRDGQ